MAWSTLDDLSAGQIVTENHMDAIRGNIEYLLDPNKGRVTYDNSGDYTTTSTTLVDIDATNLKHTITTNGGPVLVVFNGIFRNNTAGHRVYFAIDVDSVQLDSTVYGGGAWGSGAESFQVMALAVVTASLSAASHTFKIQWKVTGGTGTLWATGGLLPHFAVIEL